MQQTIIFDMDGVIVESEPIYRAVSNRYFATLGIKISDEVYETFVGASAHENLTYVKQNYSVEPSVAEMIQALRAAYLEEVKTMEFLPIVPNTRALIELLQNTDYQLILASSANRKNINLVLDRLELTDVFEHKVSGAELPKSKPDPAIFLKAAELGKVAPKNCLVIEDSRHGVTAAKAAGMSCVGYQNPYSGNQDLSHADAVVKNMNEIDLELIDKLLKL
ncbi:MAG: HAD family phosphatase [Bacteroidota bacterium]